MVEAEVDRKFFDMVDNTQNAQESNQMQKDTEDAIALRDLDNIVISDPLLNKTLDLQCMFTNGDQLEQELKV